MSTTQTTSTPTRRAARTSPLAWIAGGVGTAALLVTLAIAVSPASRPTGPAQTASSSARRSRTSTRTRARPRWTRAGRRRCGRERRPRPAGDEVVEQVVEQQEALVDAVDGFVGATSTDDTFEADLDEPSSTTHWPISSARPQTSATRARRCSRPTGSASRRASRAADYSRLRVASGARHSAGAGRFTGRRLGVARGAGSRPRPWRSRPARSAPPRPGRRARPPGRATPGARQC
jgi:hypothetical protein